MSEKTKKSENDGDKAAKMMNAAADQIDRKALEVILVLTPSIMIKLKCRKTNTRFYTKAWIMDINMKNISVLIKPASGLCNMSCDYCFYCDEAKKRQQESYGFMSQETLKNIMRKTLLYTENFAGFVWQGGEPTLRGLDFFRTAVNYQRKYSRGKVQVSNAFQTNGYALTQEWCDFFRENNFLVGLSVDGTKQTHDAFRHGNNGEPSFERVIRAAELMDKTSVEYNILTVATSQIAENIDEIYSFYKQRGFNYQQYIACLEPYGETRGMHSYSLTPKQYGEFLSRLFELWYEDLKMGTQPYIRQFENYAGMAAGFEPEACEQRGKCGVSYVIEADGSVYPCDFYVMDEFRLGNLNEELLSDIDKRRLEIGFIEHSLKLTDKCRRCRYFYLCRGGCMRNREQQGEAVHNYLCEGYELFFDKWYDVIMRLGRGRRFDSGIPH